MYWTGTVSVVSHTGLGGARAIAVHDVKINYGPDLQAPLLLIVTGPRFNFFCKNLNRISALNCN